MGILCLGFFFLLILASLISYLFPPDGYDDWVKKGKPPSNMGGCAGME